MSDLGPNISTGNNLNLVRASSISKMFQQQDNSQSQWSIINEQRENDGQDHATVQVMGMGRYNLVGFSISRMRLTIVLTLGF